jgi:hypothetical protein
LEKMPKGKIPDAEVGKEQAEELKAVSAITKMLAEKPEIAKEMAEIFEQVAKEKEKELTERISKLLAEKVKDIPADRISGSMQYWYPWVVRYWGPWYPWRPWIVQYWYPWYAGGPEKLGMQK